MRRKPVYLYITPFFPSPETWRGGYSLDAVNAIRRDGRYDVRVMTFGSGGDYVYDDIYVMRIRRFRLPFNLFPFLCNAINNILFGKKLKLCAVDADDIAFCHVNLLKYCNYAIWLKKRCAKIKIFSQIHCCYGIGLASGRLGNIPGHCTLLYLYYRYICEHLDGIVFVSQKACVTFGKFFKDAPEGMIYDIRNQLLFGRWIRPIRLPTQYVVYNGFDSNLFKPKAGGPAHAGFVVGCVANFQEMKGQMTLLEAVVCLKDKIPNLIVRFVGSGETLENCKRFANTHNLGEIVSFETEVRHSQLPSFYQALDLFVLPSRLEGFCCAYIESFACGVPVVGCKGVSIEEVVLDKDRWLVSPLDAHGLADVIYGYYQNRWTQRMRINLNIDRLWSEFLDKINF